MRRPRPVLHQSIDTRLELPIARLCNFRPSRVRKLRPAPTIESIFHNMGYAGREAHVCARVTYYHQVGYYALGVRESRQQRLQLPPFYTRMLTGRGF